MGNFYIIFVALYPDKMIHIDLSCNGGGVRSIKQHSQNPYTSIKSFTVKKSHICPVTSEMVLITQED